MASPTASSSRAPASDRSEGRARANTTSSTSTGSRFRSLSSGLTDETAQTSILSHEGSSYFLPRVGSSSSRLHTLAEMPRGGRQREDAIMAERSPAVHPQHSPTVVVQPAAPVSSGSTSRLLLRIGRRSTTDLARAAGEASQGDESGAQTLSIRRKFIRTLSDFGKARDGPPRDGTPMPPRGLTTSSNTSTSSVLRPSSPGSPYLTFQAASAAASMSNVGGSQAALPHRVGVLRKMSNMALRGRSRASTVSAGSSLLPSAGPSSRSASPLPPLPSSDDIPRSKRPANRGRSASEPLRSLVPAQLTVLAGIDYFDLLLPRELRLVILDTLVRVCIEDLERHTASGSYVGEAAKANRWVGKPAGLRELVKCSHVSKTWHNLAFDLQLWRSFEVPLIGNDVLATPGLLRILGSAWALKTLDLTGMANLGPAGIIALADSISCFDSTGVAQNALTDLTLTGCRSMTANSLHYIVSRSPHLRRLHLSGLRAVTNSLFDVLANCVVGLRLLNVNRCTNAEASAVLRVSPQHAHLVDLRLAGLRSLNDGVLEALGLAFPYLQRLDIRDAFEITNEGLRRFVAWPDDPPDGVKMILAPPYDKPRRLTRLRHLLMSNCVGLNDGACDALQGTCPELIALEVGCLGPTFQLAGLVALLKTTPKLRKLDLDNAFTLQDRILPAINSHTTNIDHLILSNCAGLTERGLHQFIKHYGTLASREATLELDNTVLTENMIRDLVMKRKTVQEVVAIDCRAVGRHVPHDLAAISRPRRGVRGWRYRDMDYHDDERFGPKELDAERAVLKTFGTLALLDAADQARDLRRKRTDGNISGDIEVPKRPIWARARSNGDGSGCTIS